MLHSDQLATAQRAARWLNADRRLGLGAGARRVGGGALDPPGRPPPGAGAIAVGLILVGFALLIVRAIAGHYIVNGAGHRTRQHGRPGHSAWEIVTARLADSAWTTIGVGAVVLFGLWLQGGHRSRPIRAALAPALQLARVRLRALAALLLVLVLVGPDGGDPRAAWACADRRCLDRRLRAPATLDRPRVSGRAAR